MATAKKTAQPAKPAVDELDLGDEILGGVDNVDQDSLLDDGQMYSVIQWRGGSPQLAAAAALNPGGPLPIAYSGGFFMDEQTVVWADEDMIAAGWHMDMFTTKTGVTVKGWSSQKMHIAVIERRRHIIVKDGETTKSFAADQWDEAKRYGSPRVQRNYLVTIKGLEAHGPFVITLSGTAGMSFNGDREYRANGVLPMQTACVLAPVNESLRKKGKTNAYGHSSFYAVVGVELKDGAPVFVELGKAPKLTMATVPHYMGPGRGELTSVGIKALYVGNEQNAENQRIWEEQAKAWVEAWKHDSSPSIDEAAAVAVEDEEIDTEDVADEEGW